MTLQWCHNGQDSASNHQHYDCLFNRLFRRRSKRTSKLRVTGLCVGNSPGPVNSPHKGPVTRKMFPFDDVIMTLVKVRNSSFCRANYSASQAIFIQFALVIFVMVYSRWLFPLSFRITSLAPGQSCYCPGTNDATLKNIDRKYDIKVTS